MRHTPNFLLIGLLCFCGCKTVKQIEGTSKAIENNRAAIEQSTQVIGHNANAVADSTGIIESNKVVVEDSTLAIGKNAQALDEINTAMDKLKSNKGALGLIIALFAILLIIPSLLALFVWWQTKRLMSLWLQKENAVRKDLDSKS